MRFRSIRNRIVFTYMAVFLGTLLLLNIIIYALSAGMIIRSKKEVLQTNRDYFAERMETLQREGRVISRGRIEEEIERIREHAGGISIRISSGDGRSAGTLPPLLDEDKRMGEGIIIVDGRDTEEYFYLKEIHSYEGEDYLVEYVLTTDYEDYLKILVKALVLVEILGLVISCIAGIKTGNSLVRPITRISDMTERITSENLGERLPTDSSEDEVARLSGLINNTLEELEASFENQKRFISNVSHELRTPIAVMKGYLDIYSRMGAEDEALADEAIGAIHEENENMKRMVEKLLFLARGDLEGFKVERENTDPGELLEKLRRDYSSAAEDQRINLNIEGGMKVFCDQNIVLQMMRSLVDNAVKYGGEKGIEIGNYTRDGSSVLYVRDFGRGMSAEEKERVFERFYRGDRARNRDEGSMGLGLSIVSKLAEIHRCTVEIRSSVGEGSTFMVVFPGEESEDEENIDSRR